MRKMISTKRQQYDYKNIAVGDVFSVRDQDVVLLKALGRVKDMPPVRAMSTESNPELVPTRHVETHQTTQESLHLTGELINENETQTANETSAETASETQASILDTLDLDLGEEEKKKLGDDIHQSQEFSRMLRERAVTLGVHVDGRWSDARVQREIDEHNKKTYQHMDMRATE